MEEKMPFQDEIINYIEEVIKNGEEVDVSEIAEYFGIEKQEVKNIFEENFMEDDDE